MQSLASQLIMAHKQDPNPWTQVKCVAACEGLCRLGAPDLLDLYLQQQPVVHQPRARPGVLAGVILLQGSREGEILR